MTLDKTLKPESYAIQIVHYTKNVQGPGADVHESTYLFSWTREDIQRANDEGITLADKVTVHFSPVDLGTGATYPRAALRKDDGLNLDRQGSAPAPILERIMDQAITGSSISYSDYREIYKQTSEPCIGA